MISKGIRTYLFFAKLDVQSQLKYPLDFFVQQLIWLVYTIIPYLGLRILFENISTLGEWTVYHVGILYGVIGLAYDLSRMLGRSLDDFHKLILRGELDLFLLRPVSLPLQLFGSNVFLRRLAGIVQYLAVLLYSIHKGMAPSAALFAGILISTLGTFLVFLGLLFCNATLCLFTVRKSLFSELVVDTTATLGYYPLKFIQKAVRALFFTVIPVGVTAYLPISRLLFSRHALATAASLFGSVAGGALFFLLTLKLFTYSLRYYKSCT